jgi:hypothetical protein
MSASDTDSSHTVLTETASMPDAESHNNAEIEYASLIRDQTRPFFPKFVAAMSKQDTAQRNRGRCAVVEFSEGKRRHTTIMETATEFSAYLSKPPTMSHSEHQSITPRRRLFVLEDLPYDYILTLGSQLRVPPSFFASHWEDPSALTFNHRDTFRRCTLPHFRIHYASSYRLKLDAPPSSSSNTIYAFDTRVSRHFVTYHKNGILHDEPKSHQVLSFWSSQPREDGSWDAILLVDPGPGARARCVATGIMCPLSYDVDESSIPKRFLFPEMQSLSRLPEDCSRWPATFLSPTYLSMFDDTIHAFQREDTITGTDDPSSVVEIPRRLAIATLMAYLRRRYENLVKLQNGYHFGPETMQHNYLSGFSKSSCSVWSSDFFDFIVGHRAAMRICMREIQYNYIALGLDMPQSPAPQWERDGWDSIKELGSTLNETLKSIADGYLQYVTIQEARISNSNAHSLSKITMLTMLFIPLSTLASIFSMSGDYLPGQTKAWVFWIVALLVIAMLAFLYWYGDILNACRRSKRQVLPLSRCDVAQQLVEERKTED